MLQSLNHRVEQPSDVGYLDVCDCREGLADIENESIRLTVTSPPYNIGKDYDEYEDRIEQSEWCDMIGGVFEELHRVTRPDGKVVVNVGKSFAESDVEGRFHFYPLAAWTKELARKAGFDFWDEYLWDKRGFASRGGGALMGSYPYPTNFMASQRHEHVLVFRKWSKGVERHRNLPAKGTPKRELSAMTKERWRELTQSLWEIEPVTQSQFPINHGAVFPVELPRRLIQLYSFYGDTVLDPFVGAGTTSVAAKECGRRYVGFDVDERYVEHARDRVSDTEWYSFPDQRESAIEDIE